MACHTIAATLTTPNGRPDPGVIGDGLVPLASALGQHEDPARSLPFSDDHRFVAAGMSHFGLLERPEVYDVIRDWLLD